MGRAWGRVPVATTALRAGRLAPAIVGAGTLGAGGIEAVATPG